MVSILTYHVITGAVKSGDIDGKKIAVKTLQGQDIKVNATEAVMINDAKVAMADIVASNGVIHVIDKVILPPTE